MSYDVEFYKKKEDIGQDDIVIDSNLNITFNLIKMFNWAFDSDYWVDEVEGYSGKEVSIKVHKALLKMIAGKEVAAAFNSPNGWGTYPHGLNFLHELHAECLLYPEHYVHIDK